MNQIASQNHEPLATHIPVLLNEVLTFLDPQPGQIIVDATVGGGGHAAAIATRIGAKGQFIAIEQDSTMLRLAQNRLALIPDKPICNWLHDNFAHLPALLEQSHVSLADGVFADLGFASDQVADPTRGLSFQSDGPLDMRLGEQGWDTAADLIQTLPERELANIFFHYGEERFSRRIARRIVQQRDVQPITTTKELANVVRQCIPGVGKSRIDPATRVFQALRIAVNRELENLDALLHCLPTILKPGGRVVIISFHSLEDRMVKRAFKETPGWNVLTKKPIMASEQEVASNPRSRSAKLRAATLMPTERRF